MKVGIWQIIYVLLMFGGLVVSLVKHGEPRDGTYNFYVSLFTFALEITLLALGGFFG